MDNSRSGSGAVKRPRGEEHGAQKTGSGSSANGARFAYMAFGIVGPEEKQDNNFSGHVRLRLIRRREDAAAKKAGRANFAGNAAGNSAAPEAGHGPGPQQVQGRAVPAEVRGPRPLASKRPEGKVSPRPALKPSAGTGAGMKTGMKAGSMKTAEKAPGGAAGRGEKSTAQAAPSAKAAAKPSAPARLIRTDGPEPRVGGKTAPSAPAPSGKAAPRPQAPARLVRVEGAGVEGKPSGPGPAVQGREEAKREKTGVKKEAVSAAPAKETPRAAAAAPATPAEAKKHITVMGTEGAATGTADKADKAGKGAPSAAQAEAAAQPAVKDAPRAEQKREKSEANSEPAAQGPTCDLYAPPRFSVATLIAYTLLASALILGWAYRGEEILTAKEGTGYILGIVGGSMMLLLVLYPLRKTARFMRRMGAIRHWFRAHMVLGLVGPALVIFHANFSMGSLNSSVALTTMILVAVSGLIGRYIYAGIHYGLYGREMDLNELRNAFKDRSHGMKYVLDYAPAIQERILNFDARVLRPRYSFMGSIAGLVATSFAALWLRLVLALALRRTLRVAAKRHRWTAEERKAHKRGARRYIVNHIAAAMVIARFKVYERLFSLWHLLHLPLFLLLVLTAIIHVVAVHMF